MSQSLPDRRTLSVKDAAALEPFYRALRPHLKPKTWRQLQAQGLKRIEPDPLNLEWIVDNFNANKDD
tara:strand:+ start:2032 stop:2232 length:201 start_codon:yes stop_codon:yes gene_type:complete